MSRIVYDRVLTDAAGERGGACLPPLLWFLGKPWTSPQFPVISILSLYIRAVKRGVPMLQFQIKLTSPSAKLFLIVSIVNAADKAKPMETLGKFRQHIGVTLRVLPLPGLHHPYAEHQRL